MYALDTTECCSKKPYFVVHYITIYGYVTTVFLLKLVERPAVQLFGGVPSSQREQGEILASSSMLDLLDSWTLYLGLFQM